MEEQKTHPLIIISSRTGNTMTLGHAICDGLPGCVMMRPEEVPEVGGSWERQHARAHLPLPRSY